MKEKAIKALQKVLTHSEYIIDADREEIISHRAAIDLLAAKIVSKREAIATYKAALDELHLW